jgi:hypothetical protein
MFWTEALVQKTMFGQGDQYVVSANVTRLIRFAEEAFPDCDSNFHRSVAFLTHSETQTFLRPMLVQYYGGLDQAQKPTLEWLDRLGSFDTFARATRNDNSANGVCQSGIELRGVPDWYRQYLKSDRFESMCVQAEMHWSDYMGTLRCSVNARDPFNVWHHNDYGRLGEADEFRYLIPLCNDCHCAVGRRGPRLTAVVPESVKQWL